MGWLRSEMPPPALDPRDERLPDGAPDLRGRWKAVRSEGAYDFLRHGLGQRWWQAKIAPLLIRAALQERIEQCGLRAAITGGSGRGWVLHQLTVDGTWEHGVGDLTIAGRPVRARGTYEEGRLVLQGRRDEGEFRVVRELVGDELVVTASSEGSGRTMRIFCKRLE